MTKLFQFVGGFILSFILIVGLFTGIIWYTREYTPAPEPGLNVDSLMAAGVLPDSLNIYDKERYLLGQQRAKLEKEKEELERKEQEVKKRQEMISEIRNQLDDSRAEEDSIMNVRYKELAKYIENMKPIDAGPVMNKLSDFATAKIIMNMSKRKAGKVLNQMDQDKIARVSQMMTMIKD